MALLFALNAVPNSFVFDISIWERIYIAHLELNWLEKLLLLSLLGGAQPVNSSQRGSLAAWRGCELRAESLHTEA